MLLLNWQLKCADSISLDTLTLNILGYVCYTYSIVSQMFNDTVRTQYQLTFDGGLPLLSGADLFYTCHGLLLQLVLFTQVMFGKQLWGFRSDRRNYRLGNLARSLILVAATFVVFEYYNEEEFKELNVILTLSTVKVFFSLVKQIPQLLHNIKRRSMYGISKLQICLDMAGAIFCLLEFYLKNTQSLAEALYSNRGKTGIAVVTLLFSSIFLFQFSIYTQESPEFRKEDDAYESHEMA